MSAVELLRELQSSLAAVLEGRADVAWREPTEQLRTPRIEITPANDLAARVDVMLVEDGLVTVFAGRRAFFEVDLGDEAAAERDVVRIVTQIAAGELVERFVGPVPLHAELVSDPTSLRRLGRRIVWPPFAVDA